jgi:hypothetical protein
VATPYRPPPRLRRTILLLAAATLVLFAGGIVYGYSHRNDRPCGKANPVRERPGMLGQTEYLCPDGRTVTD